MSHEQPSTSRSALRFVMAAALAVALAAPGAGALAQSRAAPEPLSWYGDPSAPNLSGVWVRADAQPGVTAAGSKEGWKPWAPPLKGPFEAAWKKRVADAASGKRTDDPVMACLPPGMPRFMTGLKSPLLIIQTPGRITLHRDGWSTRRVWLDGRPQPDPKDLEDFYNGNAIGHYDGKTLVIETIGVRDQPIDSTGVPHSEKLKIIERISRVDDQTLKVDVDLIDPVAYRKPMKTTVFYKALNDPHWEPNDQICTPKTAYHSDIFVQ